LIFAKQSDNAGYSTERNDTLSLMRQRDDTWLWGEWEWGDGFYANHYGL